MLVVIYKILFDFYKYLFILIFFDFNLKNEIGFSSYDSHLCVGPYLYFRREALYMSGHVCIFTFNLRQI